MDVKVKLKFSMDKDMTEYVIAHLKSIRSGRLKDLHVYHSFRPFSRLLALPILENSPVIAHITLNLRWKIALESISAVRATVNKRLITCYEIAISDNTHRGIHAALGFWVMTTGAM